ncbi:MAG: efflux transporter outer membrane subunit [Phycisphaerae bacterium]|nr:efflux transporter outer membrane subunit [Phycisphaerae bacterium]
MQRMKDCFLKGLAVLCSLAGCTVGPDYQPPAPVLPDMWAEAALMQQGEPNLLKEWWVVLDDPVLMRLIEQASQGSRNLRQAYERIAESRALRDYAAGRYYPAADFSASYTRSRESANTAFAFPAMLQEHGSYTGGFDAAWELDLFGGIRRSVESAQALLEASVENFRDVQASLYAEVAADYVELRTVQMRLQFAMDNIKVQKDTLTLTEDRYKAGLAPELDVAQARQNLANTEAQVPSLRTAEIQVLNRLAVLLGQYPQELDEVLKMPAAIPLPASDKLPSALPADLLRQRPDIRRAERQLAAQTAQTGVTVSQLYPSFSLWGSFALVAERFPDVGNWSSRSYSYGPSLGWRVFEGGRIRSLVRADEARMRQLLAAYEHTVLTAVGEVETAAAAYVQESQREEALQRSVRAAEDTVRLVSSLYRSGLTDFQNVLDAQRTLFSQQDMLAVSRGARVLNLIRIYKALGGGWNPDAAGSVPAAASEALPTTETISQ